MIEGIIVNTGQFVSRALRALGVALLAVYNGNARAISTLQGVLGQRLFALLVSGMILVSCFGYYQIQSVKRSMSYKTLKVTQSLAGGVGNTVKGLFNGRK